MPKSATPGAPYRPGPLTHGAGALAGAESRTRITLPVIRAGWTELEPAAGRVRLRHRQEP
jgi:hypothetical protein